MKLLKLIQSFEYDSIGDFGRSMVPSVKYGATGGMTVFAVVAATIEKLLGISHSAFIALCVVMLAELVSGLVASRVRGDKLSSVRWSRFGLKLGLWFVVLYVAHIIGEDFRNRGSEVVAAVIDWTHTALVLSIFFEYLISVLENISVISGKSNTRLIEKIKEKFNNLL